ncbi:13799_t:CDS:2, partial [Acaulospora morrowiae]
SYVEELETLHKLFTFLEESTSSYLNKFTKYIVKQLPWTFYMLGTETDVMNVFSTKQWKGTLDLKREFQKSIVLLHGFGEHRTGKTTLTKIASNEVGRGVIYVNVPENLDFTFEEQISFTGQLAQKNLRYN